ncbi:WYL domain-containing protein, partial [Fusobacterium ulcerans]|uniref:WYL domain-containing protein n=1 Tax=Fusobacterium ulcerans TaxID=861 RepID=UPI003FEEA1D2
FIILDILSKNEKLTLREITDKINNDYFSEFKESNILDTATIRLKLSEYVKEGILKSEKNGKEIYYNFFDVDIDILSYKDMISFFSEVSPIGVIGSFIMDRFEIRNTEFSFKHNYILHAMESEILYKILEGLNKKSKIELEYFMKKDKKCIVKKITPLKVFISVQTGGRYIVGYLESGSVFMYRLDKIKDVKILEKDENFDKLKNEIENKLQYSWGVSFKKIELETLRMVLYIGKKEEYIIERLRNEGRHGVINQLTNDKWEYKIEVYDALEMLPWIRTFIGRIISLESSNENLCRKFYRDFESVYRFYNGGKNDI